jgi:type I restriction enzyme R subunit
MAQFTFLKPEFPTIYESAQKAFRIAHRDPRTACFYARRAVELTVNWLYKYDNSLQLPYQDNLSALIHEPTFKILVGETVFNKTRLIIKLGNNAVHSAKPISSNEGVSAVRELFHVAYWLAHTYGRNSKPEPGLNFDLDAIPKTATVPKQTFQQLQTLEKELSDRDEKLSTLLADKNVLDEELKKLRAELANAKKVNIAQPDTHDYSEAQTRDLFIDLLLKEVGWKLDQERDREYQVTGMPNQSGQGFIDYVLWGNNGKPLGIVEAKRTRHDPRIGQQQAKLYADCLETQFGQRPLIFYTNGYEHWLWDDTNYPPRQVQGFYKKAELELLIQRRTTRKILATATINPAIAERYYQTRGIRRITEAIETDKDRKTLIIMATGAGKTRTAIALVDMLMRANWVKRALFLADRVALVNQAINVFKKHLPDAAPVNLVTEKDTEGRVFASTYPTMMGLINDTRDGQRRFGVGHFDLIIIDEAHRSVFQKYRAIFNYFDSLLLGLTATPKDEIDRNTYGLFDLESGVPTDNYQLEEAVKDGFLVPPQAVSVPLKFQREGIKYDELSPEEQEEWDNLDWDEDGNPPDQVGAAAINKWLFNKDTVDKVLAHLMTRGLKVAGGDRLGKTIIFAKNQDHANFIAERFNVNYPHYKGEFARVIHNKTPYAQSLIDDFSKKDKAPHIAISVDMLDTGIDVPEVVNLVLFKMVHSRTKFWQMLGRGTRRCPDLFGLAQDKEFFYLFDYCQNLEYFKQNLEPTDAPVGKSLGKQLFTARLELMTELDKKLLPTNLGKAKESSSSYQISPNEPKTDTELRQQLANLLRTEVSSMNSENFVVRPKRKLVEKYTNPQAWQSLSEEEKSELTQEVAGLPTQLEAEAEETKRFDILILKIQLTIVKSQPTERLKQQVQAIAGLLEEQSTIPLVQQQLPLIQDVQTDEWWQDVTLPMLEVLRKRLRGLVGLIEKRKRQPIYTDFEDEMGEEIIVELPGFTPSDNFEKFRAKARAFLRSHQDHIVIFKLRTNKQLTSSDLSELEKILAESGVGEMEDIIRAKEEAKGLGLFVRSLVGLDREVAKQELAQFLSRNNLNSKQIEFVNMIVDYLTEHGVMDAGLLYESPFTDITPQGPNGLFTSSQVGELISLLTEVCDKAVA